MGTRGGVRAAEPGCGVKGFLAGEDVTLLLISLALLFALYARLRDMPALAQAAFYLALWQALAKAGSYLTIAACAVGYPLQDHALAAADAAIGFDWYRMHAFISARPWLDTLLWWAYVSCVFQIAATVVILAALRVPRRNAEFAVLMVATVSMTILISAFVPAIGPADAYGLPTAPGPIIRAIRAGGEHPNYAAIISFPSFHTTMALLLIWVHRGLRTWPLFLPLNLLMLASIPYSGDHYLVDMIGGAIVAACAIMLISRPHQCRPLGYPLPMRTLADRRGPPKRGLAAVSRPAGRP
jgi:membrane-associated phospholipid phosphatase